MRTAAAAAVLIGCDARISVDNATMNFVAADGRVRFFHGVNAVHKAWPWHPVVDRFDASSSLAAEDIANLKKWGLNVVRLGVMWPGVEPAEGQINATYLGVMRTLVDDLYAAGIYTIVDFHQDVLMGKFCGEGVPDWLVPKLQWPALSTSCAGFVPWMAAVVGICKPFKDYHFDIDPATGNPRTDECLQNSFIDYTEAPEVVSAWGNFLSNATINNHFAGYWRATSTAFKGAPGLLGYDLLNEPMSGDYYANNDLLLPGRGDLATLQPLYKLLHDTIRAVDTDAILFYEPPPFPDTFPTSAYVPGIIGGVHPVGFTAGPAGEAGAAQWSSKQAMSYHIYSCGFATTCDRDGNPSSADCSSCDSLATSWADTRAADVARLGGGIFLTEFGAGRSLAPVCSHQPLTRALVVPDTPEGRAEINRVTAVADAHQLSWAYWQFKYFHDITTVSGPKEGLYNANGTVQEAKLGALSRTYAPVVAGKLTAIRFDPVSAAFRLTYTTADTPKDTRALATEIYLNTEAHYPGSLPLAGFETDLINAASPSGDLVNGTMEVFAGMDGKPVDVAIVRPYSGALAGMLRTINGDLVKWEVFDSKYYGKAGFTMVKPGNITWWKGFRIYADGKKSGDYTCVLEAQDSDDAPKVCGLEGPVRHDFLFDYGIEIWAATSIFGIHSHVQTIDAAMFGPLLNKMVKFTWLDD
jgi:endoglycosylceramidase